MFSEAILFTVLSLETSAFAHRTGEAVRRPWFRAHIRCRMIQRCCLSRNPVRHDLIEVSLLLAISIQKDNAFWNRNCAARERAVSVISARTTTALAIVNR